MTSPPPGNAPVLRGLFPYIALRPSTPGVPAKPRPAWWSSPVHGVQCQQTAASGLAGRGRHRKAVLTMPAPWPTQLLQEDPATSQHSTHRAGSALAFGCVSDVKHVTCLTHACKDGLTGVPNADREGTRLGCHRSPGQSWAAARQSGLAGQLGTRCVTERGLHVAGARGARGAREGPFCKPTTVTALPRCAPDTNGKGHRVRAVAAETPWNEADGHTLEAKAPKRTRVNPCHRAAWLSAAFPFRRGEGSPPPRAHVPSFIGFPSPGWALRGSQVMPARPHPSVPARRPVA